MSHTVVLGRLGVSYSVLGRLGVSYSCIGEASVSHTVYWGAVQCVSCRVY